MDDRFQLIQNTTQEINSQCKVVVYDWDQKSLGFDSSNSALSKSSPLDISSQIIACSFNKTMQSPSGQFSITLSSSPNLEGSSGDWKDIIKRGSWLIIYMSQDGDLLISPEVGKPNRSNIAAEAKKIRCIGYVDRVAPRTEVNEKGAFDITYTVTGRDFGCIYEDTNIWHNVFKYERVILDSIATSELNITADVSIKTAMETVHDLFFFPKNLKGAKVNDNNSLTEIALQWLLPRQLVIDVGFRNIDSSGSFWGGLKGIKNFDETAANIAIEKPTDYLSGNAWSQLKQLSVPEFHELFTETTDDGLPQLTFRPIPFAIDKSKYKTVGQYVQLYKDLNPLVEVPSIDVLTTNLAESDYERYNSFLATVATTLINTEDNISILQGSDFPKNIQDSIKRHGFRAMHVTVDSIVKNAENSNGRGNPKLLIEFNELLYDYWNNAVFAENGSCMLIGRNNIKVGKCLKFGESTPYVNGKRYYIEGYTDTWTKEENGSEIWTQEVMLTRGFEEIDLRRKSGFGSRNEEFKQEGEFTPYTGAGKGRGKN